MFGTCFKWLKITCSGLLTVFACSIAMAADSNAPKSPKTTADIIAAAPASDWRDVSASDLMVMNLPQGQVFIELADRFAPNHAANIRTLAHQGFFDGLAIIRVQDNYVTQWGDPDDDDPKLAKPLGDAKTKLPAEFFIPYKGLPITPIKDVDGWAPVTGYVDGFPVAADPKKNKAWLTHCYGMIGAARSQAIDSSNGTGLYAIIGHAPRGLDLNITVVGRVLRGIEYLSALPRGGATMGFYDKPEQRVGITKVQMASDINEAERPKLEVLKSDSKTWASVLESRRNRSGWFVHSFDHTEVCASSVPVRNKPEK